MKRWLAIALMFVPLIVGAETVEWTLAPTFTDGTPIPASVRSITTSYLRIWNAKTPATKQYLGETRNGGTSWTDNILVRANAGGMTPPLVAGDNVFVTVSAAYVAAGNVEYDSAQSVPYAYMIPKPVVVPPKPPSCSIPTGVTIRQ